MAYGTAVMGTMILLTRVEFSFDPSFSYTASLLYLGIAGSVMAFLGYLTLLKNIGSDRTAYIALVTPLVALFLSTLFEGYTWSVAAVIGVLWVILGNVIALRRDRAPV